MECNKDEATRAKALAEIQMQNNDFVEAQKLLMKAQRLYSGLENLSQMLAVCDVHISAEKTINGLVDWYGILQVMHFEDHATIKKQYRKLALLLHPDKNQSAGAEAAFKLVWEASKLLLDKENRSNYDIKHRIYTRIANRNSGQQCAAANNANDSNIDNSTFWTCCQHCGYSYKHKKEYLNTLMYCSKCQRSYQAYETGANGVPAKSSTDKKEVQDQGPSDTTLHNNVESTGAQSGYTAAEGDKLGTVKEKLDKTNGGPETGASKPLTDKSVSKTDQAPSMSKNKTKIVEEPIESVKVEVSDDIFENKVNSKDNNNTRRSSRKRRQNSYGDDFISPTTKRTRSKVGLNSDQTTKKQNLGVGSSKRLDSGKEKPLTHKSPDPEFNSFELTTSSFAVNQVWSLYDSTDGMPRFYARIDKVLDTDFKLWITWIDPVQDNKDRSLPIACGIFQDGDSKEVDDHLIFSCQMFHLPHNSNIVIYPRKGEIWGVFRGWDISWSASLGNHKRPYEYDYVEILSNFNDEIGLGVAYLGKVEGFVSLFRREAQHGYLQLQIPPREMLRFSHKVPSFKMTGNERAGVPPGCFELDTAALPEDLFKVDNSTVDGERQDDKADSTFPEASKVRVQATTTLESGLSPKKRQNVHEVQGSSSKASNIERNGLKKSLKSVKAVDDSKLRKYARRLSSETNNLVTSKSSQKTSEKKSANNAETFRQPDESCLSGKKLATPKKPDEKVITADSSRNRKSPRNSLSQSRGNGSLPWSNVVCALSSSTTRQKQTFNFENQRSCDKFKIGQIWALYSNDNKGLPRSYAQIKKIDTKPEFKLHVAPLVLSHRPDFITHPISCGRFKLKTGKAEILAPRNFSHHVKSAKRDKNRFEVYPEKGEIWALYKNWNTKDFEELEIAEVVETEEQNIKVMFLTAKGINKCCYEKSLDSKPGFVEIQKTEASKRFSHQIPAFRHEGRVTRFGDGEYWELDPKAVLDLSS